MDAQTNAGAGYESCESYESYESYESGYGTKSDTDSGIALDSTIPFSQQIPHEVSKASMPNEAWGVGRQDDARHREFGDVSTASMPNEAWGEDEEAADPGRYRSRYRNGYPWDGYPWEGPDPARPTLSIGAGMVALVARELTGYSQRRLARAMGTSQPSLAKIESGARVPTLRTLARIAQASGFELVLGLREPEDDPPTPEELENFALLGFLRLNPEDGLADFVVLREPGPLERKRGIDGEDDEVPRGMDSATTSSSRSTTRWPASPGSSSCRTSSRPRPSPCT